MEMDLALPVCVVERGERQHVLSFITFDNANRQSQIERFALHSGFQRKTAGPDLRVGDIACQKDANGGAG